MTARAITTALLLTATVGCSSQLPQPATASTVPGPTNAFVHEQPSRSPATPCRDWDLVGTQLEWTIDRCWKRPVVATDPPPFHLAHNVWSGEGKLMATEHAPWKKPAVQDEPDEVRPTVRKSPRMITRPFDERISTREPSATSKRGG